MRILILHNLYQQPGGEDAVVEAEERLLRSAGHEVRVEYLNNKEIVGLTAKARTFSRVHYNPLREDWLREILNHFRPDIVHIHNFFPLLSFSAHETACRFGCAVVQTIHNYRMLCSGGYLMRKGQVCEKCVHGSKLWGVAHRCYRGSLLGSIAVLRMQRHAILHNVWSDFTHAIIALTQFSADKLIEGGFPAERVVVKPNFVPLSAEVVKPRNGVLYVGRLSPEKGVTSLIQAWWEIPDEELVIVGEGPERPSLEKGAPPNVTFLGHQSRHIVNELMQSAALLVMPSIWYEGFPVTLVEAYRNSLPVFCSRIGSLRTLVDEGVTGGMFEVNDPSGLARSIKNALANREVLKLLGQNARSRYLREYTPEANITKLEEIYLGALRSVKQFTAS